MLLVVPSAHEISDIAGHCSPRQTGPRDPATGDERN